MTNFSQSIANVIDIAGPAPSYWGSFVWGADKWGDGTGDDLRTLVEKYIVTGDITPSDDYFMGFVKFLDGAITFSGDLTDETLTDANGYSYVFTSNTTEAEDRDFATYVEEAAIGTSYSSGAVEGTTWSDA